MSPWWSFFRSGVCETGVTFCRGAIVLFVKEFMSFWEAKKSVSLKPETLRLGKRDVCGEGEN